MIRVKVLTVSDRAAAGVYVDETGPALAEVLDSWDGFVCTEVRVIPDEFSAIADWIVEWADTESCDVILTNGGTGVGPRDVTPEATASILDREIPGIGELMRRRGFDATPLAALSRQTAGHREQTLIINLPGSPKGALESLDVLPEVLRHGVKVVHGGRH